MYCMYRRKYLRSLLTGERDSARGAGRLGTGYRSVSSQQKFIGGCFMKRLALLFMIVALCLPSGLAQQTSNSNTAAVPHFVRFGGLVKDAAGRPITGSLGITFALYRDQEGGPALWLETQNVSADNNGHYTVSL